MKVALLLVTALSATSCVSLTPSSGRALLLIDAPRVSTQPPSPEPKVLEWTPPPHSLREVMTARSSVTVEDATQQSAQSAHLAFLRTVGDVSNSARRISGELIRLKASRLGIAGRAAGLFVPHVEYGERQLGWIQKQLTASNQLATTASTLRDPAMQLALLRLSGTRLEAAMMGCTLLAAWTDFLDLVDIALQQTSYSVEKLLVDMDRWQKMLAPSMAALASLEPGQVEAAAKDMPALVGHLTDEFAATREAMRVGMEQIQKLVVLKELIETATMLSAMKFSLPPLPPSAPLSLGLVLSMEGNGVMVGTRMVVSVQWVEMMRHLVRAGVISGPVVGAAIRIQVGHVLMAQARDELPKRLHEALGDGPEVRGMRVTGRAGAGMNEPPRHHVLPREFREWFEKRGFSGEMDIDQFCIEMEQASHQAIHGGGDWRLGRLWAGEWNRMIMRVLRGAELATGRMLTRSEVLNIVAANMKQYGIPMNFTVWRGR